jgi:Reverse transcriptase (RNA-dependent DNA polymerase).
METIENDDIYTIAFADDLLIIINGNSRNEIETKANRALQLITDWCKEHKLTVSINKSKAMLMKGIFHTERLPNIKIGEQK